MPLSVVHRVSLPAPQTHLVHVETTLRGAPDELVLFMPVWAPGSYLVREYARHVEGLDRRRAGAGDEDPQERVARRGARGAARSSCATACTPTS